MHHEAGKRWMESNGGGWVEPLRWRISSNVFFSGCWVVRALTRRSPGSGGRWIRRCRCTPAPRSEHKLIGPRNVVPFLNPVHCKYPANRSTSTFDSLVEDLTRDVRRVRSKGRSSILCLEERTRNTLAQPQRSSSFSRGLRCTVGVSPGAISVPSFSQAIPRPRSSLRYSVSPACYYCDQV